MVPNLSKNILCPGDHIIKYVVEVDFLVINTLRGSNHRRGVRFQPQG